MKKKALSILLCCLCASVLLGADSLKIKKPSYGEVVSPMNYVQWTFAALPIPVLRDLMDSSVALRKIDYSEKQSIPRGIDLVWSFRGERAKIHYEILLAEKKDFSDARRIAAPHSVHTVQNLIPGKSYYWKVQSLLADGTVTAESDLCKFTVDALLPRVIALPDCWNVRDLGGKTGIDGRKVAYGKIYRSGGFNFNSNDGKVPGMRTVTEASVREALDVLGIRTELDLRNDGETAKMTESPLGPSVKYIHISSTAYGGLYTESGMKNFAENFRVFTKAENYPIDFHCIAGADRTGTLAFLLEAVLGCNEDDIRRDYVYTTVFNPRHFRFIDALIDGMAIYGAQGDSLRVQAEKFLLASGVTVEEIRRFQEYMLGSGLSESPAFAEYQKQKALREKYTLAAPEITLVDNAQSAFVSRQQGKVYDVRPNQWRQSPLVALSKDEEGAVLVNLRNPSKLTSYPGLKGFAADRKYMVCDQMAGTYLLNSEDGTAVWSASALEKACFTCQPNAAVLLTVTPVAKGGVLPAEAKAAVPMPQAVTAADQCLQAPAIASAPVIDGKGDDAVWTTVSARPMVGLDGRGLTGTTTCDVKLASDADGEMLYALVTVNDNSCVEGRGEHDSDRVWSGDTVELFFANASEDEMYHLIVSRAGSTFDEVIPGGKAAWDLPGFQSAVSDEGTRWTLEVAIPLKALPLKEVMEINVCAADYPDMTLCNLVATGGGFHNRAALRPLVMGKK